VPVTTSPSDPFSTKCEARARKRSRSSDRSSLNGVTIAVRISPSTSAILRDTGADMFQEFKDFLLRGNIVELAVAFVMGLAFAAVVNSLVNDLIMPVIAMIIGEPDFSGLDFTINDAVFRYGAFLTAVIQFLAIAVAVFFFVVRPLNALMARTRKPAEDEVTDDERRHRELLETIRGLNR
jgi:large conductance mechanosensitive channel